MTTVELILLIGACITPVLALLFVLKKSKQKQKDKKEEKKEISKDTDDKKEEKKEQPTEEFKLPQQDFSKSELKNYMANRSKSVTQPFRKSLPTNFEGLNIDLPSRRRPIKENKSIAEQIQDLSPELKALIVAGVLDKKDYGEY